ncbi:HpaII family restriction endonuclease [Weissella tructae]|uniref:Type II restriction enzyme HpaII (Endonuclease HpaII) n=2 Tax=Weissella TaxID=46255 RepID=A0A075U4K6_9LACO|nr:MULTISPECIES: HpaII family restriction endonuclease [Weissella]AIG65082.1 type II restriction enzyme HpaII (endonuclease HpaII) [Weissella tructae]AIM62396.1 type II restriction enzyme HpaII (endonuclease HpaII) [Weissella ceti]AIM63733.1 type II restriction enzyme HpaII (endonuclease HpaII) [Weissella ceti]ELA07934.1 type II restriction enzyme HpaII (endonuclease HpaII) [Weissella ceti NC36]QVV91480.1 HpaII family restriction endonuclease [Weissella tructae]
MANKINKGEWSELYVFLSVLATGKLFAADEDLNKMEDVYYTVLKAINQVEKTDSEYLRDTNRNVIVIYNNGTHKLSIPISEFVKHAPLVLEGIRNGKGRSFEIPEIESFLETILLDKIKAPSDSKKDLVFQVHDEYTGLTPNVGFSVKSYIGGEPTLVNSSGATVFTYQTSKSFPTSFEAEVNAINTPSKIKDRIQKIYEKQIHLNYSQVSSQIFHRNLQMIDFRLPEILSYLVLSSYFVKGKRMPEVVKYYSEKYEEDRELIEHKIKDFLVATALGMEPNTIWNGLEDANGGYIVVKNDGEILCYHIYDRNKLRSYLYNHTKFDTPSTGRTGSGMLESIEDGGMFKLSVQIRFEK